MMKSSVGGNWYGDSFGWQIIGGVKRNQTSGKTDEKVKEIFIEFSPSQILFGNASKVKLIKTISFFSFIVIRFTE